MAVTQVIAPSNTIHNRKTGGPVAALMATLLCILGLFGLSGSAEAKTYAYVFNIGSGDVSVIDTRTYEVVRRTPVGEFPCDITLSLDGRLAFEVDRDQDTLSVIDWQAGHTLETITFAGGKKPHILTLSPDGRRLWVQERETSTVSVFDAQTYERVARLSSGKGPATTEFAPSRRFAITTQ